MVKISCRNLRKIRKAERWGIVALSKASGVGSTTIHEMENDKTDPRISTVYALARVLKCNPWEICVEVEVKDDADGRGDV